MKHEDAIKLLILNFSNKGYFTKIGLIDDALHCRFGKIKMIKGYETKTIDKELIDDIIGFIGEFYQSYMCSRFGTAPNKMKQFMDLTEEDLHQLKKFGILVNFIRYVYNGKNFDALAYGENMELSEVYDSLCTWAKGVA